METIYAFLISDGTCHITTAPNIYLAINKLRYEYFEQPSFDDFDIDAISSVQIKDGSSQKNIPLETLINRVRNVCESNPEYPMPQFCLKEEEELIGSVIPVNLIRNTPCLSSNLSVLP